MSTEKTMFNIYFCNPPSMQVINMKGKAMQFISGRYHTKDESEIAMLDDMCENGSGSIFKDKNLLTMSSSELDPMNVMRAKFFKEFQEMQAAQLDPNSDRGESVQGNLKPASTSDIAPVAAGGNGVAALMSRVTSGAVLKS